MNLSDRLRKWILQPTEAPAPPMPAGDDPVDHSRLRAQLGLHEGVRDKIYTDSVGKVSGGIGRNLTDKGFRQDEIDLMYRNDVAESIAELDRVLPWWRRLDEVRRRVLVDMMFNMGAPTLLGFKNTLGMVERGQYREAAENMLASKWSAQTGGRARRLAAMMGSGMDWSS